MAIVQISKIQQRSGNLVDLPQLADAEFGWANDTRRLFIGKSTPNENIEVLTSYSTISFSQFDGAVGNLNISNATVADGQALIYDGINWVNRGGNAGGLITLGNVGNVKLTGGAIGYVLQTDGLGNLSWTPKGTLVSGILNVTKANPAVVTTVSDNFFQDGAQVTFLNPQGMDQLAGNIYYANAITSTTFALYTDSGLTTGANSTAYNAYSYSTVSATTVSTNIITVANSSPFTVGSAVQFVGNMSTSGISNTATYYVQAKPNTTSLKIATSSDANASNVVPLQTTSGLTSKVYQINGQAVATIGGSGVTFSPAGGSDTTIQYNQAGALEGSGLFTYNYGSSILTLIGNANVGNLNATGVATATRFVSNIATGTAPLVVTSTTTVANLAAATSGTVTTAAQPNITSVGTLTSLTVSGNITPTANISYDLGNNTNRFKDIYLANSTIYIGSQTISANATSVIISGNIVGNISGNIIGALANGNSNVNIPAANGNVNISAAGNANVLVVTGTGANVDGTAQVKYANIHTGTMTTVTNGVPGIWLTQTWNNASIGFQAIYADITDTASDVISNLMNLRVGGTSRFSVTKAGNVSANFFIGNGSQLTGVAAGSTIVSGTSNVNIPAAGGNVNTTVGGTTTLVVTSTGANIAGTANITGNANVGNLGTAQVLATANVTAPQLISNIATGTAPLVVTSNTVVANLNADLLEGYNPAAANTANTIALRNANGNLSANFFIGNGSQLTGITVAAGSSIVNGTSNVNIPASGGNINLTVGGTTTLVVTGTGANIAGNLVVNNTAYAAQLSASAGTITQYAPGVNVFQIWNNASVAFTGVIYSDITDTVSAAGSRLIELRVNGTQQFGVSKTGNVSGNYFVGNGTAISSGIMTVNTPALSTAQTWNNASATFYNIYSDITDTASAAGSRLMEFRVGGSERFSVSKTGNVSGNFFIGNGSQLTGIIASASASIVNGTSNVVVDASANVRTSVGGTANVLVVTSTGANMAGNLALTGYRLRSITTGISSAGGSQGTATALTTEINVVSTVTGGQGVRLPTAVAGMVLIINNTSATPVNVYPATGGAINSGGTNVSYQHTPGASIQYYATSGTQWYTVGATFA